MSSDVARDLWIPAVGFDHPWALVGIIVAAVPILLHLLKRQPVRRQPWAAVELLERAVRRREDRLHLRRRLLLFTRVLLLLCVVLAVANPRTSPSDSLPAASPVCRLIVIDRTGSMQRTTNGQSRFEVGLEHMRRILKQSRPIDSVGLLGFGIAGRDPVILAPSLQHRQVANAIDQIIVTAGTDTPADALEMAVEICAAQPPSVECEVMLVSEFQARDWDPADVQLRARISGALTSLAQRGRVRSVPIAAPLERNLSVTGIEVNSARLRVGETATVSAAVHNHSQETATETRAECRVGGTAIGSKTVAIPQDGEGVISFDLHGVPPGIHDVQVRISDDSLSLDNQRVTLLAVLPRPRVLIVSADSAAAGTSMADYVHASLAPDGSDDRGSSQPLVATADVSSVGASGHANYDGIFLCGIDSLPPESLRWLQKQVRSGALVVFCPTHRIEIDRFNKQFAGNADSLLPVRLVKRIGSAIRPVDGLHFETGTLNHPLFRVYDSQSRGGLARSLTFERFQLEPAAGSPGVVPLTFENGDPAIVISRFGDGHSAVFATSADGQRWSTWHLVGGHFTVIVNELVRQFAGAPPETRQFQPGDEMTFIADGDADPHNVSLIGPGGVEVAYRLVLNGDIPRYVTAPVAHPGLYRLLDSTGTGPIATAVVNIVGGESDSEFLRPGEQNALYGIEPASREAANQFSFDSGESRTSSGAGYSFPLIVLAGVLLVIEFGMSSRLRPRTGRLAQWMKSYTA